MANLFRLTVLTAAFSMWGYADSPTSTGFIINEKSPGEVYLFPTAGPFPLTLNTVYVTIPDYGFDIGVSSQNIGFVSNGGPSGSGSTGPAAIYSFPTNGPFPVTATTPIVTTSSGDSFVHLAPSTDGTLMFITTGTTAFPGHIYTFPTAGPFPIVASTAAVNISFDNAYDMYVAPNGIAFVTDLITDGAIYTFSENGPFPVNIQSYGFSTPPVRLAGGLTPHHITATNDTVFFTQDVSLEIYSFPLNGPFPLTVTGGSPAVTIITSLPSATAFDIAPSTDGKTIFVVSGENSPSIPGEVWSFPAAGPFPLTITTPIAFAGSSLTPGNFSHLTSAFVLSPFSPPTLSPLPPPDPVFPVVAKAQFALSTVLENRFFISKLGCLHSLLSNCCAPAEKKPSRWWRRKKAPQEKPTPNKTASPWVALIGENSRQKVRSQDIAFETLTGGAVVGVERCYCGQNLLGAGVGYTYTYVHYKDGRGHAKVQQESVVFYGLVSSRLFYLDFSIWGGPYQIQQEQHASVSVTGTAPMTLTASPKGWLVTPHVELGYDFDRGSWSAEPFIMFDWANSWELSYKESGAPTLNRSFHHQYTSLLRTETGVRFYQSGQGVRGRLVLQEKVSYVNQAPFNTGPVSATLLTSSTPLSLQTVPTETYQLVLGEIALWFIPTKNNLPYFQLAYQTELSFKGGLGSRYQSNLVMLQAGKSF